MRVFVGVLCEPLALLQSAHPEPDPELDPELEVVELASLPDRVEVLEPFCELVPVVVLVSVLVVEEPSFSLLVVVVVSVDDDFEPDEVVEALSLTVEEPVPVVETPDVVVS